MAKRIKELKPGEQFKICGKILSFVKNGNSLSVKMDGMYEEEPIKVPTLKEVEDYCLSKGYNNELAQKFYNYYETAEPAWTDKHGIPVTRWKQKISSVWFRPEHKIKEAKTPVPEESKYLF